MSQPLRKNKTLGVALKILVALAALAWVFSQINVQEVVKVLSGANFLLLAVAFVLFILSKVTSSFRLNVFFRNHDIHIPEKENLKLYWLGMFYNIFLPGGVSGDGYKIYLLKKKLNRNLKELFTAVLIDRISGVVALASFAGILLSISLGTHNILTYSWITVVLVPAGFYLFFKLFFKRYQTIYFPVTLYSFLVQGLQIVAVFFILKSFGILEDQTSYIFVFLISSIVAIIPISIGGAGTRELAFYYGAQYLSLSPEISIAISLTFYLITLITSLTGILYSFKLPEIK